MREWTSWTRERVRIGGANPGALLANLYFGVNANTLFYACSTPTLSLVFMTRSSSKLELPVVVAAAVGVKGD